MNAQLKDESPAPKHHLWMAVGNRGKTVSPQDILSHAEEHFGLTKGIFEVKMRGKREFTDIKHMVRFVLRLKFPSMTIVEIGRITSQTDHGTVISSFSVHLGYMQHNPAYRTAYTAFYQSLAGKGLVNA